MAVTVDPERKLNGHVPHDVFTPTLTTQTSDDLKTTNTILACPDEEMPLDENRQSYCQLILSWRFGMAVMLLLSIVINYLPHITLPMALICDQRSPPLSPHLSSNVNISQESSSPRNFSAETLTSYNISDRVTSRTNETSDEVTGGEFNWDPETQGLVLSSLFFTGMVGPLLSDAVRRYLGNKWTLAMFMMTSALLTFVSPVAARTSAYHLMAVRILQGVTSNTNQPILGDTLAWWSPHAETLTLSTFVNAGHGLSCVFAFAVSGYLCSIPLDNGWPFVFYVLGAVSVLWIISWVLLTSRKPEEHRFISEKEKKYITTHRKGLAAKVEGKKKEKTPYKKIFTSIPVYAYLYASSSAVWIMNVNFTFLPIYLNKVHFIPVGTTGLLVAILTGILTVASFGWTAIGNFLVSSRGFTVNKSRKLCLFVGFTIAGAHLVWLSFLDKNSTIMAIGVLCSTMLFHSVSPTVIPVVPLDMAPRYSGFLTAVRYSLGRLLAISGPLIISEMTPTNSHGEWQHVWILLGCLHLAANLVFVCFGDASLQPWATPPAPLPSAMAPLVPSGVQAAPIVRSSSIASTDKTTDSVQAAQV